MTQYKKILVPFDSSKYSRKALSHAIDIARRFNSKLFVITIVDVSDVPPPGMLLGLAREHKKLKKTISDFLKSAKNEARKILLTQVAICKSKGVDVNYDIIHGNTTESILKFAHGRKINLIIIGSHGLRGVGKIKAIGSVSRKVSEMASCPVMIVH